MKSFILIHKSLRQSVLTLFILVVFAVNGQTTFQEVSLKTTPIKVQDRKEDVPLSQLATSADSDLSDMMSSAASTSTGVTGISETVGELSVSPTGAAVYSVPIKVPPGINGVVPTIAISYNSQAGNGLAGYGWNVSGISIISRIPSTQYHDGVIDPVDFDALDRFSLDGQRLMLKSGTYGANGAVYETEVHSNLKITSHGTSSYGSGPQYFKVSYPDGAVAYYGKTSDSRSHMDYAISHWQNPQQVRVDYNYTKAANNLSIASIKYGHRNGSTTAPNEVRFEYKTRLLPEQSFIGGVDFRRSNILSKIIVEAEGTVYRRYELEHNSNFRYQRLTKITEKSGDNSLSYSPISFSYKNSGIGFGVTGIDTDLNVNNIERRNSEMVPLDYTGNGEMDFIIYPKDRSQRNKLWLFNDIRSGQNNIGSEVNLPIFEGLFAASYLNASNKMSAGQGFVTVEHAGNRQVKFKMHGKGGTALVSQLYEKTWNTVQSFYDVNCDITNISQAPMEYLSGDFNGDGITDLMAITEPYTNRDCSKPTNCDNDPDDRDDENGEDEDGNNYAVPVPDPSPTNDSDLISNSTNCNCTCTNTNYTVATTYLVNLDPRVTTNFVSGAGNLARSLSTESRLTTADVDGDGKTDILHFTEGRVDAYALDSSNRLKLLWSNTDSRIKLRFQPLLGDYNGDGKTDFLMPTGNNSTTYAMFHSTGIGFLANSATYPFTYRLSEEASTVRAYSLLPTDINGDGRTDILEYITVTNNGGANGKQTLTIYNNISPLSSDESPKFSFTGEESLEGTLYHFPIPVFLSSRDMPNDNLDFATISNDKVAFFTFNKNHLEETKLKTISNNGIGYSIIYDGLDPTAFGGTLYSEGQNQVYPYVDIAQTRGFKVVSGLVRSGAGTTNLQKLFQYQGAVVHSEGLGFMGFTGLARSNWYDPSKGNPIFNISKHDIARRGAVIQAYSVPYTVNFNEVPSDYITRSDAQYGSSLAANKVFKLWQTSNTVQNRLLGTAVTTGYIYDAYNNPTRITTDYSGQGGSVVNLTYTNSTGGTYFIGRPIKRKETHTIAGNNFSTEEEYTYTGYLLTRKRTKGNGTAFDVEDYTHDIFGNVITKTIAPNGTAPRSVSFKYDASGRYLIKSTDVEGLATHFEYNTGPGTLKKETDPYENSAKYGYDAWYRLVQVTDYRGNNANTTYVRSGFNYTVTVSADDGNSTISEYDALKRIIKKQRKNVLGQWVAISYEYDELDRPYRQSEPYIGTGATQWNSIEYDLYGRVTNMTEYTGKVTTFTYSGLSVTVNDGIKTVTTTKDAMGNVTRVTDPGGTIDHTYYGNGGLKSSTYNGIRISIEQDGWGRRTKLIDPSAGTYSYAYNGFGEMLKETTPKGETQYEYSDVGKLSRKTVTGDDTDMVMDYTYDGTDKLLRTIRLTNADGNNGTTVYAYDAYKRLAYARESNTYAQFTKWYAYDGHGRIATEQSEARLLSNNKSTGIKVKNTYAHGQLKRINDHNSGEELWNITGLNAWGQVTASTMGDGQQRTNTYDNHGYLTQMLSQKNVNATATDVMRLSFDFDARRGILNSRTNSLFGWNESFGYDGQDRLTGFTDNNGEHSQSYDTKGRIDTMSQLGTFSYASTSFQQTGVELNAAGRSHYADYAERHIGYNAFKSPVEIHEQGKGRYGFMYNADMGRAHMFYGDTQADKLERPYRRHYSADGGMEITWEKATGKTTFVIYVGGDAYSAPAMRHSEQGVTNSDHYLYLHRDYLGSILAITYGNGNIKEKRHFDAWGNMVHLTDGQDRALDANLAFHRGYTGHEHLHDVGLVHMNGRLYDPALHRFLMPDNYVQNPHSTLSYNRYGYVWNNPLMYTDPSGEFAETAGLLYWTGAAVVSSIASSWETIRSWDWKSFGDDIARPFREAGRWVRRLFGDKGSPGPTQFANELTVSSGPSGARGSGISSSLANGNSALGLLWNGFSRGFTDKFAGFKALFNDPGMLFQTPTIEQAFMSSLENMPFTRPLLMGAKTIMASIQGNVEGMGYIYGGEAGKLTIDGVSALPGVGILKGFRGLRVFNNASKSSTNLARTLGVQGERAVGTLGSKTRIPSLTGTAKYRIPDGLSRTTLTEVKNVKSLNLTRQLKDFHLYSTQRGLQFNLYARPNTTFSAPLQNLINQGSINVYTIPGL
ncbi:putative toxin [Costertonia aggregata]|uniref:Tox-REase-7 domain-containing protein n=1 Tax=Costertonia aggregata TaxID=343403 RepID=A0A7H9ANP5_9FLAO|nr:putative toxin [Costertonia aggregata]QLG44895.1 hypothetical protein HYG79_05855 [Costertonia aggregata]